jgi:hypothetical protein
MDCGHGSGGHLLDLGLVEHVGGQVAKEPLVGHVIGRP